MPVAISVLMKMRIVVSVTSKSRGIAGRAGIQCLAHPAREEERDIPVEIVPVVKAAKREAKLSNSEIAGWFFV
jgi:hypothetical protein